MYKTKTGATLNLSGAKEIAAGGEGKILEHPDSRLVAKIYHQPKKASFATHLESLSSLSSYFIAPIDVLFSIKGECVGFTMKYVNFNDYFLFNNLFNKGFCTSNGITKDFKIQLLGKLKAAIEELHKKDIVVGDLNMYNLFFSKKGEVLFVDVDSYQTNTQPHSGVLLDEIRDWTTTAINKQTDIWSYDILAFWTTCFVHPFKWVAPGNKETLEQRVKQNHSILSKITNIKIPPLYEQPTGETEKQFKEIFSGRRYFVDFANAVAPINIVVTNIISSISLSIRELFSHVTEVNVSPEYITVKQSDGWLIVETKTPKVTRVLDSEKNSDKVFPSSNHWVHIKNHNLYHSNGITYFTQPEFFYYNGFLTVIDYGTDIQYNFNLNNQLGGIDHTQTSVFAKSIIIRDTPIQNFGAKKFLNIPLENRYQLIEVPLGTKNATYNGIFYCVEYTENNQIKFRVKTVGQNTGMDLDYLPFFTSKGPMLFVPEDGYISIYKDWVEISKLDVSICSRTSKLYSCNSGILLLENNILYLLNTK